MNIWRRSAGRLKSRNLIATTSTSNGPLVADDFFEVDSASVNGASSQAQSVVGALAIPINCTAASSQAASASATLDRTNNSASVSSQAESSAAALTRTIAASSAGLQAEQAGGSFGATLSSSLVASQGQTGSGTFADTQDSQAAASQAQSSESTHGLTISGSIAAAEAETVLATLGRTIDSVSASSSAETVLGTDGAATDSFISSSQSQNVSAEIVLIEKTVRWKILKLPPTLGLIEIDCTATTGQGQTVNALGMRTTETILRTTQSFETNIRTENLISGRCFGQQPQAATAEMDQDNSDMELLLFLLAA